MSETPDLKELIEQPLLELLDGKAAHASPLACLEDLSAGLAGRKVEGHSSSIWEIVLHLNYWMTYDHKRILGGTGSLSGPCCEFVAAAAARSQRRIVEPHGVTIRSTAARMGNFVPFGLAGSYALCKCD